MFFSFFLVVLCSLLTPLRSLLLGVRSPCLFRFTAVCHLLSAFRRFALSLSPPANSMGLLIEFLPDSINTQHSTVYSILFSDPLSFGSLLALLAVYLELSLGCLVLSFHSQLSIFCSGKFSPHILAGCDFSQFRAN